MLHHVASCRGAKKQNFPDSNFLCAKTFRTKHAQPFLAIDLKKRVLASHNIAKECAFNVLELWYNSNMIIKSGQFWNRPVNGKWSGKVRTVLKPPGKWKMIWENPDSFETVRKMGNDLEKSGQFWNRPENGKWSGKLHTVLKQSGKWEMIWKIPESFETVPKMGNDLEKSRQFWNSLENWKWSEKSGMFWNRPENGQSSENILTVVKLSGKIRTVLKPSWEMENDMAKIRTLCQSFLFYAQKLSG